MVPVAPKRRESGWSANVPNKPTHKTKRIIVNCKKNWVRSITLPFPWCWSIQASTAVAIAATKPRREVIRGRVSEFLSLIGTAICYLCPKYPFRFPLILMCVNREHASFGSIVSVHCLSNSQSRLLLISQTRDKDVRFVVQPNHNVEAQQRKCY